MLYGRDGDMIIWISLIELNCEEGEEGYPRVCNFGEVEIFQQRVNSKLFLLFV